MPQPFSAKFEFVLKALCLSRGRLAAGLGLDKSVVGRWARGAGRPSAESLAKLTAFVASRAPGFTVLDWDRDIAGLARVLRVDAASALGAERWLRIAHPLGELLDQILATSRRRGGAYEGFYRSTRPFPEHPGRFIHDRVMIRRDENALLTFELRCGGVKVRGWLLPQQNQLFMICAESASDSLAFGIFNGVSATQASLVDGLLLGCALDANRTPTACALVFKRVAELTGDPAGDEARFEELTHLEGLAPEGSVPDDLIVHLTRDIGPAQLAVGGDWLLRLPLGRSLSRGAPEE